MFVKSICLQQQHHRTGSSCSEYTHMLSFQCTHKKTASASRVPPRTLNLLNRHTAQADKSFRRRGGNPVLKKIYIYSEVSNQISEMILGSLGTEAWKNGCAFAEVAGVKASYFPADEMTHSLAACHLSPVIFHQLLLTLLILISHKFNCYCLLYLRNYCSRLS